LPELLVKGKYRRVVDIPYFFQSRSKGKSKFGPKEVWLYLESLLELNQYRAFKFTAAGFTGVGANMGILFILVSLGLPLPLASATAIGCSIFANFLLSDIWALESGRSRSWSSKCLKFYYASTPKGLANFAILLTLTALGLNYLISNLIGIFSGCITKCTITVLKVWGDLMSTPSKEGLETPFKLRVIDRVIVLLLSALLFRYTFDLHWMYLAPLFWATILSLTMHFVALVLLVDAAIGRAPIWVRYLGLSLIVATSFPYLYSSISIP